MTSSLIASAMLRDPLYHIECLTAPSYTKYLISSLQTALHAKAKAEAGYRFYTLYDNLWTPPAAIYGRLPPQDDSAGVDGMDARIYPAGLMERFALLALMGSAASGLIRSSAAQAL